MGYVTEETCVPWHTHVNYSICRALVIANQTYLNRAGKPDILETSGFVRNGGN